MPRGRRAKPVILPTLQGRPEKPKHLDAVASKEWDRIVSLLEVSGNLSTIDGGMLELYCRNYSKWVTCENHIAKNGLMVSTPNNYEIMSPYVMVSKQCEKLLLSLAAQFGLTPKSRNTLKQSEPKKQIDQGWQEFA